MPHHGTGLKQLDAALLRAEKILGKPVLVHQHDMYPNQLTARVTTPIPHLRIHTAEGTHNITDPRIRVKGEDIVLKGTFSYMAPNRLPGVQLFANNGKDHPPLFLGTVHKDSVYLAFNIFRLVDKYGERTARGNTKKVSGSPTAKIFNEHILPALKRAVEYTEEYNYAEEKLAYAKQFSKRKEKEGRDAEGRIRSARRTITAYINKIEQQTAEIERLQTINEGTRIMAKEAQRKAESSFTVINSLWGHGIHDLKFTRIHITFLTAPIFSEGIPFGRFHISIPLDPGYGITISAETETYNVNGYTHPHVSGCGAICWGTAETILAQLRSKGRHAECIPVLLEFLRTYHHDHQYSKIENWNHFRPKDTAKIKTQIGKRWEECYAKVKDPYECAGCWAPECPYQAYGPRQCFEKRSKSGTQLRRCVACGACTYGKARALKACRETHAGKRKSCHNCPITTCKHAGKSKAATKRKTKEVA